MIERCNAFGFLILRSKDTLGYFSIELFFFKWRYKYVKFFDKRVKSR